MLLSANTTLAFQNGINYTPVWLMRSCTHSASKTCVQHDPCPCVPLCPTLLPPLSLSHAFCSLAHLGLRAASNMPRMDAHFFYIFYVRPNTTYHVDLLWRLLVLPMALGSLCLYCAFCASAYDLFLPLFLNGFPLQLYSPLY